MDVPGCAMVTGAASGIGRACAAAFAREGTIGIALLDISAEALADVKSKIERVQSERRNPACRIEMYQLDVSDEILVEKSVNTVAKDFRRVDYVFCAAGIAMKHPGGAGFAKTQDWKRVLDVTQTAPSSK